GVVAQGFNGLEWDFFLPACARLRGYVVVPRRAGTPGVPPGRDGDVVVSRAGHIVGTGRNRGLVARKRTPAARKRRPARGERLVARCVPPAPAPGGHGRLSAVRVPAPQARPRDRR